MSAPEKTAAHAQGLRQVAFDVMAKAILPALIAAHPDPEAKSHHAQWKYLKNQTIDNMDEIIDWDDSSRRVTGLNEHALARVGATLKTTCDHLTYIAFSDAYQIARLAMHAVSIQPVSESGPKVSFGNKLLKDSKTELLKVARLTDEDKWTFLTASERSIESEKSNSFKSITVFPSPKLSELQSLPSVLKVDDSQPKNTRLTWVPQAADWLAEHDQMHSARIDGLESGCPAARLTVEVGERKTLLLSAFWEAVIDKVYPAQTIADSPTTG